MFWIKILKKIIKILNSDIAPGQVAGAVALGSIIGFTPFFSFHNIIVFIIILLVNVNISSALLSIGIFTIISFLTDPIAHIIGYRLLVSADFLTPFWTFLYNLPIIPFTRFYNTIMLGSLILSLVLFFPVFVYTKKFIIYYRLNLQAKVENLKIMKWFKLSKIYKIYDKFK